MSREYLALSGSKLTMTTGILYASGNASAGRIPIAHTGANRDIIAFQTSDQTLIQSALLTGTQLSFPVLNGERYQFEFGLAVHAGAGGARLAVSGAAATSFVAGTNFTSGAYVSGVGENIINIPGAATAFVQIIGAVQPSADGTYYAQFGQFAANAGATVLKRGSYVKATRLL